MRICIDLTSLADNFSGIERFALSITKELIRNKEIEWILLFKNYVHKEFCKTEKNVKKIVIKGKNKLLFNQVKLPLKLLEIDADKFFFPAFPAPFFFFNKNAFNTIHDLSCWDCPESNKLHMILYFKLMYWKASLNQKKIITVSEFSKKRICEILRSRPENVSVIYNGIDQKFYHKNITKNILKKNNIPEKFFLCLSTLEPRKNLQLLIRAYSKVCEDINVNLVLAGRKGWLVENILSDLPSNVKNKIYFTGFIEEDDLPIIYKNALWFIFPSLYEGFGIPPLEAMATGTPVLSSDAASMPEILGDAAIYFNSNDEIDLLKHLKCIAHIEKTEEMKAKCIDRASLYSWEKSAEKLIDLFCEL